MRREAGVITLPLFSGHGYGSDRHTSPFRILNPRAEAVKVKTPRTRHSNAEREPMTIELGPDEVSRVSTEAEASPTDMEPGGETVKEDIAASETGTEPTDHAAQPATGTPSDEPAQESNMPFDEEPRPAAGRPDAGETAERPSAWTDAPAVPPPPPVAFKGA